MSTPTTTPSQQPSSTQNILTASCTTAVPGKHGNVPIDACNSYYNFSPQYAPAVAVAVLFGILLVAHIFQAFAFRKPYCWVLIMGAAWETTAFILHALGSHDQQNVGYATAHQLLYLLAPLWINAFVYMSFARLVHFFLPEKAVWRIKAVGLAKWFVWADVISFVVQMVGGIMASPGASPDTIKTGIDIYMGGMGLQQLFILCFSSLMVLFRKRATMLDLSGQSIRDRPWRPALYALFGVLVCITIRIIYRISEFAGGVRLSNPVPFHETYSYSLDAFPMMLALLILAILHPGRTLVGPDSGFPRLSRKEKKAMKKEKKAAKEAMKEEKKRRKSSKNDEQVSVDTSEFVPRVNTPSHYETQRDREEHVGDLAAHGHHHASHRPRSPPQYAQLPAHPAREGY